MREGDKQQREQGRQGTRATDLGPSTISGVTLSHDFSSSLLVSKICHLHMCSVTSRSHDSDGRLVRHAWLTLLLGWLVVASRCLFAHCSHHQGTVTERGGEGVETLRAS